MKGLVALPPRDVLLILEGAPGAEPRELVRLKLSADPDLPRFFLQTAREKHRKSPEGPFYRRLTAELDGARLYDLERLSSDRIVRFSFDQTPGGERRALVLELTGRHSNLVLLDGGERVLEMLVAPPKGRAEPRLSAGEPWRPPPGRPRPSGPGLCELLTPEAGERDDAQPPQPGAPLSFLVERVLGREVAETSGARARRDLLKRVDRRLGRAARLERGLIRKAEAAEGVERVREDGELLKAHFDRLKRGLTEVELDDFFAPDGGVRVVSLEPDRSPTENIELTFARYRKLLRAAANVNGELEECRARLRSLEELRAEAADEARDPTEVEARAMQRGLLSQKQEADVRRRKTPAPRKPYRVFTGSAGGEIRVGRSARDNDELTLRHSKGSDLWLHTADAPGSHVVLRLDKGAEPDPDELLDAAHLAAHFSPLKDARKVAVHVARRKLVHKPKGAKAGLVTLSGGKVLALRVQPERLKRLLGPS